VRDEKARDEKARDEKARDEKARDDGQAESNESDEDVEARADSMLRFVRARSNLRLP